LLLLLLLVNTDVLISCCHTPWICRYCCHCLLLLDRVLPMMLLLVLQVSLLSSRHMMHMVRLASARRHEARLAIQLLAAPLKCSHHPSDNL
jgi:hypothetical protein